MVYKVVNSVGEIGQGFALGRRLSPMRKRFDIFWDPSSSEETEAFISKGVAVVPQKVIVPS